MRIRFIFGALTILGVAIGCSAGDPTGKDGTPASSSDEAIIGGGTYGVCRGFDVRLVAATNKDVEEAVADDAFRGDLFARLAGWTLHVPPLRLRRDDVLRLAQAILARVGDGVSLTTSAAEALLLHAWPYNVRELEQVLAAAAIRAKGEGRLLATHLPPAIAGRVAARGGSIPAKPPLESRVAPDRVPSGDDLRVALEHFGGNVKRVAAYFGRDRKQIYRWAEQHGIDVATIRGDGSNDE